MPLFPPKYRYVVIVAVVMLALGLEYINRRLGRITPPSHSHNHHCLNLTSKPTPDPHFTHAHGKFYLTFTANDRIPMWDADRLIDFYDTPNIGPVWRPPPKTKHSARLWAPELHALHDRWYIYYAAQHPEHGNKTHRMYVLGGPPATEDPHQQSKWAFLGSIKGMDQRQWAIDGTVFHLDGKLYFVYSGWPIPPERPYEDVDETVQQLFIIRLSDPTTADSEPVLISRPSQPWERTGPVAINEGPQWLESPKGEWRGLVYSCGASWTKHYKMATLRFTGGDPLDPSSWQKSSKPMLQNADGEGGPFGPGHGSFLHFGNDTLALFHGTEKDTDGNQNRKCWVQKVDWKEDGPHMEYVPGRGCGLEDVHAFLHGSSSGDHETKSSIEHERTLQQALLGASRLQL